MMETFVLRVARSHSAREWAMILLAYRHGMRASEVCGLRMADLSLNTRTCSSTLWPRMDAEAGAIKELGDKQLTRIGEVMLHLVRPAGRLDGPPSQVSDVGSIPIARSISLDDSIALTRLSR
jgi:hypothetical protein